MPAYYTVQSQFGGFLLKKEKAKTKCSGINLLFDVLIPTDILLIARTFPCSYGAWKNTRQLVKHPSILSTKTPNYEAIGSVRILSL